MVIPRGQRWFDSDPRASFEDKVKRAVKYYATKDMEFAEVYVHSSLATTKEVHGLRVLTDQHLQPDEFHFVTQLALDKSRGSVV